MGAESTRRECGSTGSAAVVDTGARPRYPRTVLTPERALRRILASASDVTPLPCERTPLSGALGRALAEDLRSTADLPSFDASTMDGYALRAADARAPGTRLPVAFEVSAGAAPRGSLPAAASSGIY